MHVSPKSNPLFTMQPKTSLYFAAALLILAGGIWLGRASVPVPVPEIVAPAPAQSLPSGAVVLERKPAASATTVKPIKPGSKVERAIAVTVQPTREDCPPVTVDMQLIQEDGGRRVVTRSPDGRVIAGLDVPATPALIMPDRREWAAGLSGAPHQWPDTAGVWIERDLGRVRVGAEVLRRTDGEMQARVRIGWVW